MCGGQSLRLGALPAELPPKDHVILLSAIHSGCNRLLTGDLHHFGPYLNRPDVTCGVIVQTPAEFYQEFLADL